MNSEDRTKIYCAWYDMSILNTDNDIAKGQGQIDDKLCAIINVIDIKSPITSIVGWL